MAFRANAVTPRDRMLGALFVLLAVTAESHWMGRATILLSVALVLAYVLWIAAAWNNDPVAVLPVCLVAIAVQCLHFWEEFLTGFAGRFPPLLGDDAWSGGQFVAFNMAWLALFVLAALGVYRRVALAYLVILFLALGGGVGNGIGHLLLSATQGRYFPGAFTAPACLLAGIALLLRLFGRNRLAPSA
ncbi:MAG: HXXEE domain-containing protein [Candidatus Acidiferrum sp.]